MKEIIDEIVLKLKKTLLPKAMSKDYILQTGEKYFPKTLLINDDYLNVQRALKFNSKKTNDPIKQSQRP